MRLKNIDTVYVKHKPKINIKLFLLLSLSSRYLTRLCTLKKGSRSSLFFVFKTFVTHLRGPPIFQFEKQIERRKKVDKLPKRRKFKDNPYKLLIENNNYFILFKDNKNILHKEKVNKEVFDVFDENERYENARFYEYSTKLVKSIVNIENARDSKYTDDFLINHLTIREIKEVLNKLPENQKRRFIKYYFEEKTQDQIAQEENCTRRAVRVSLELALEKILKKFKN